MKKIIASLLLLTPFSLFACGAMIFIAPQVGDFLQKTSDMDHSSIVDYNDGREDMWFTIRKPQSMDSGSILAVIPVPADTTTIHINELSQSELPNSYLGNQITYLTIAQKGFFEMLITLQIILPLLFIFCNIILGVSLITIILNTSLKRASHAGIKRLTYISSSGILLLSITYISFGVMGLMFGINQGGNVPVPGLSIGLTQKNEDKVTISYSTTTFDGITMQIVSAEDGKGLTNYLERNGLPKAPSNEETLSRYVESKMNFVITHIPYEAFLTSQKKYIHVDFASSNIFFPLGVNYVNSDEKHAVKVLVLKPVTIDGVFTNFSANEDSTRENIGRGNNEHQNESRNKSITYYTGGKDEPSLSMISFYDKEKSYNHDIIMKPGVSSSLMLLKKLCNKWVFISLWLIIVLTLISILTLSTERRIRKIRILYVLFCLFVPLSFFLYVLFMLYVN